MDGPYGAITRLTFNNISELTPTWSPDGLAIVFHKVPSNQLWVMRADGTGETQNHGLAWNRRFGTEPVGHQLGCDWSGAARAIGPCSISRCPRVRVAAGSVIDRLRGLPPVDRYGACGLPVTLPMETSVEALRA